MNHWTNQTRKRFTRLIREIHEEDGRGYDISHNGMNFLWHEYKRWSKGRYLDIDIRQWYEWLLDINKVGRKRNSLRRVLTS